MRVEFLDSSILCNILNVPGKNESHEDVMDEFKTKARHGVTFVIPIAAVIETGNHIEQLADGGRRRRCAERLVEFLRLSVAGSGPWVLDEVEWNADLIFALCDGTQTSGGGFVDLATAAAIGAGDLSILAQLDRYRTRAAVDRVTLWTLDRELGARAPT